MKFRKEKFAMSKSVVKNKKTSSRIRLLRIQVMKLSNWYYKINILIIKDKN